MPKIASKSTTDRDTIRKWVEERGGWPVEVKRTDGPSGAGILRIDFPGYSGEGSAEQIEWDEFFKKFDDANLAFVYEDEATGGEKSNFNELVARSMVVAPKRSVRTSRRTGQRQARPAQAARSTRSARAGTKSKSTKAPARRGATAASAKKAPSRSTAGKASTSGARGGRGRVTRKRSR
jgi:hypothetical protein